MIGGIPLVKIHGDYCGPDWTAGKAQPAKAMFEKFPRLEDWPMGKTPLDNACRRHDWNCARHGGCTKADDQLLIDAADRRVLRDQQKARLQLSLLNPFTSRERKDKVKVRLEEALAARRVRGGIGIAKIFRER